MTRIATVVLVSGLLLSACGGSDSSDGALADFCQDWTRFNTAIVEASFENLTEIDRLARSVDEISYTEEISESADDLVNGVEDVAGGLRRYEVQRLTELTPKQQDEVTADLDAAVAAGEKVNDYYGRECDGEDPDPDAEGERGRREVLDEDIPYIEAFADSMRTDENLPFEDGDVDCLSKEFVLALGGADRLRPAGVEPDDFRSDKGLEELGLDLTDDDADGIAASFGYCDVSLAELVLAEAGEDVPAEVRSCVEENLDEDVLAEFFATVLVDEKAGEEPPEELLEPLLACF